MIGGSPRHTAVRLNRSIFTNLTLGSRRGDLDSVIQRMGPSAWRDLRDTCARAASLFPRSFTLGLDVLVRPDFRRHARETRRARERTRRSAVGIEPVHHLLNGIVRRSVL